MYKLVLCFSFLWLSTGLIAQNNRSIWQDAEEPSRPGAERVIVPKSYRVLQLDTEAMLRHLAGAPDESVANAAVSTYTLKLPRPDGRMETFRLCESPVMAPGLAKRFPQVKTYLGKGVDNPTALARIDYTPHGFHAMVLAGEDAYFIDPYFHLLNEGAYLSYYRRDFESGEKFECLTEESLKIPEPGPQDAKVLGRTGEELRTYRLAVSATGEYTQYHGGTVEGALAAIATTMNRVNGVYERDLSVRMILIDSNHQVVFLNASEDPFSGSDVSKRNQNQTTLDQVIGSENYDVGHVFDRGGGGGVASIETVCRSGQKGLGYTGLANPVGDPFDIDYVAHELGHQYGGLHTFNYCEGSQGERPYEPGSATTIMGYAGICGADNIANSSNDHFHTGNLEDMIPFVESGFGNTCPEKIPTSNTPPLVEAGESGLFIPMSTPFELTAFAADMEGDSLTYSWEQIDIGPSTPVNAPQGNAPLFRSYALSTSPTRVFPRISSIVNNVQVFGELLPGYARPMNFHATVRDNHGLGGGIAWDELTLQVTDEAGPFRVLSQNSPTTWPAGSFQTVEWEVANTDQAPVNAARVNIYLSADGGFTYPILLADSLANDGNALVFLPDTLQGGQFRVKVKAVGNVFFDINNDNITITPATGPGISLGTPSISRVACGEQSLAYDILLMPRLGFDGEVTFSVEGLPGEVEAEIEVPDTLPAQTMLTLSNFDGVASGIYSFRLIANGDEVADTLELFYELYTGAPGPISLLSPVENEPEVSTLPILSWEAEPNAANYNVEIALDPGFTDIFYTQEGILSTSFSVPVQLPDSSLIFWRVQGGNPGCGAGPFSESFFETEVIRCQVFTTDSLPLPLSEPDPIIISIITVEEDLIIRDVNVLGLDGFHVPINDLNLRLRSPEGPIIDLITKDCEFGISFDLSLDDSAAEEVPCPYADGGTYRPEEELKTYAGQSARGEWQLLLAKDIDNGVLRNWAIEICYPKPLTSVRDARQPVRQLRVFPNPAGAEIQVQLPPGLQPGARLHIRSAAGQLLSRHTVQALSGTEVVDISRLPAGLYFLQLADQEGRLLGNSKFVKTPQ
ncbi:MAG: zinc-dependent metalloprotease [Phaeodactylibacter sp.]|nr:zinc-dependent metalloprotease [Phaeodactylibacter sp.]